MNNINTWLTNLNQLKLPLWQDLPEITLYLDQVLEYVNSYLDQLLVTTLKKEKIITASMINNYVKQGIIKAPDKKRYGKHQIAIIIMIGILKQVLTIASLKNYFQSISSETQLEFIYDSFVSELKTALLDINNSFQSEADNLEFLPMNLATTAMANKIMAEYLFDQPDLKLKKTKGD